MDLQKINEILDCLEDVYTTTKDDGDSGIRQLQNLTPLMEEELQDKLNFKLKYINGNDIFDKMVDIYYVRYRLLKKESKVDNKLYILKCKELDYCYDTMDKIHTQIDNFNHINGLDSIVTIIDNLAHIVNEFNNQSCEFLFEQIDIQK